MPTAENHAQSARPARVNDYDSFALFSATETAAYPSACGRPVSPGLDTVLPLARTPQDGLPVRGRRSDQDLAELILSPGGIPPEVWAADLEAVVASGGVVVEGTDGPGAHMISSHSCPGILALTTDVMRWSGRRRRRLPSRHRPATGWCQATGCRWVTQWIPPPPVPRWSMLSCSMTRSG